jgi:hypothetical protein
VTEPPAVLNESPLGAAGRVRAALLGVAIALACFGVCAVLGFVLRAAVYGG